MPVNDVLLIALATFYKTTPLTLDTDKTNIGEINLLFPIASIMSILDTFFDDHQEHVHFKANE